MSVTFSGAFTFSGGGFTATLAPPTEATAGWFGGGGIPGASSTVQRITFATDTNTASVRGTLGVFRSQLAATGNFTNGWFGGGFASPGWSSTVQRITYATDTATAAAVGPLSLARYNLGATGTSTDGWFAGGEVPGSPVLVSTVDRITFAIDTATASTKGPLSTVLRSMGASSDNTTYGWFGGGYVPGNTTTSRVDRITYATDTVSASVRGPLSASGYGLTAIGNTTYGWYGGGFKMTAPYILSIISRITYATDTAAASTRGPLYVGKFLLSAVGNLTDGWFAGGSDEVNTRTSIVQRITYATDTATATLKGPLSANTWTAGSASGIQ